MDGVQQGMNGNNKQARRYHWHSEDLKSFVDKPHSAIEGPVQGEIVNLTDKRAEASRSAQLELLTGLGPDRSFPSFPPLGARRRRKPCFRISSCRRITTSDQATSSRGAFTARSQQRPSAAPSTSPNSC